MADNQDDTKHPGGRPLKFASAEELQNRIDEYFADCDPHTEQKLVENGVNSKGATVWVTREVMTEQKPYTITGLALALDTTRDTLIDYESGRYDDKDKEAEVNEKFSDTIKRAKLKCQNFTEAFLYTGKAPAGPIFSLKNNYGWQDRQEYDHTHHKVTDDLDDLDGSKKRVAESAAKAADGTESPEGPSPS